MVEDILTNNRFTVNSERKIKAKYSEKVKNMIC